MEEKELNDYFIERKVKNEHKAKDINYTVILILKDLRQYYRKLKDINLEGIKDLTKEITLTFSEEVSKRIIEGTQIDGLGREKDSRFIVAPSQITRFQGKDSGAPTGLRMDFFCIYSGFAGEQGFKQKKSLYDFFKIDEYKEYYVDEGYSKFLHFETPDVPFAEIKKEPEIKADNKVIKVEIVNANEKNVIAQNKPIETDPYLANLYASDIKSEIIKHIKNMPSRIKKILFTDKDFLTDMMEGNQRHNEEFSTKKPDEFLTNLFTSLINNEDIDPDLNNKIKIVTGQIKSKKSYTWVYRAILASALSLSLLKGWSLEKVEFLKKLAEQKNEPLVTERAIIGLTIALIVSYNNKTNDFEDTLHELSSFSKNSTFKAGLFEVLNFFFKKIDKWDIAPSERESFKGVNRKEQFQFFEPPHEEVSYYEFDMENIPFRDKDDIPVFFNQLNSSIFIDHIRKTRVLFAINRLSTEQTDELSVTFSEEADIVKKLKQHYSGDVISLRYNNVIGEFLLQLKELGNFDEHWKLFQGFLKGISSKHIADEVCKIFPYSQYIRLLDIPKIEQRLDLNDEEVLNFLVQHHMKKAKISKKYSNAINKFNKIVKNNSIIDKVKAYLIRQIGCCISKIAEMENSNEKYEEAIKQFKKSLEIEESTFAMMHIGWNYLMIMNPRASKEWYRKAQFLESNQYVYMNLGHCEYILGKKNEAFENYKKSLDFWNCSEEFFKGFDDDWKFIESYKKSKKEYDATKKKLREYCHSKGDNIEEWKV